MAHQSPKKVFSGPTLVKLKSHDVKLIMSVIYGHYQILTTKQFKPGGPC